MILDQFIPEWIGKTPLYPPNPETFRGECAQLFNFYNRDVIGAPNFLPPYAHQLFTEYPDSPLEPFYDRIELVSGFVARYGDAVVWSPELPGTNGAGHIDICIDRTATPLQFIGLDSNWQGKAVQKVTHNYDYVIGVLRPKGGYMPDVIEVLQSALNAAKEADLKHESALNAALQKAETFESALSAERAKTKELSEKLALYQAEGGETEATALGNALLNVIREFGYKK